MKNTSSLLHNIAALGLVQIFAFLVPMLTLPYVTRELGVEAWGKVALVQAVLSYFGLMTNWGFSLSGTRKIAAIKGDNQKVSEVFMATWLAQWLLCFVAILALVVLTLIIPFFQLYALYYFYGIGIIIAGVLFPVWFLNGLERMKEVAAIQIISRIITIPLILLYIKSPSDAPLMIAIVAASGMFGGLLTIVWMKKNLRLVWIMPSWNQIMKELKEGGVIFGSSIWISLYTTLTPTILGVMVGPVAVGYYSLADRVRQMAISTLSPISQALFPRLSHLFQNDEAQALILLRKSAKLILTLSVIGSLSLWLLAEHIVILLAGEDFRPASAVLKWLAPLLFVVSLSNIFGIQIMLPNHKTKIFNRILALSGTLSLCTIIPLIHWNGAVGASINTFLTECFVTLGMGVFLWKAGFFVKSINWSKS
jgi:O-antigen/teichoic acid export membrane protein